jgi:class 3 adenylate cyclase
MLRVMGWNDIRIRDKLIVIVAGAVAVLTTAVLISVWISAWREVKRDVRAELKTARQEFVLTEGEHLHEQALEAETIAQNDDLVEFVQKHNSTRTCAWLADLLTGKKTAGVNPEDSFDLLAVVLPDAQPLGVVRAGQPPCPARELKWKLPFVSSKAETPEITNWESEQEKLFELIEAPIFDSEERNIGTFIMGYEVSDALARHIKEHTGHDNIIWHMDGDKAHLLGSSDPSLNNLLTPEVQSGQPGGHNQVRGFAVLDAVVEDHADTVKNPVGLHIALVQSLDERFEPFRRLEYLLALMALAALVLGWIVGMFLSRPIANPLVNLASAAENVAQGQLDVADNVLQAHPERMGAKDEIGVLGRAFHHMIRGLKERLAMSTFISHATVERIQRDASGELGSERTTLAILFADVRKFSNFSETRDPEAVIKLLNDVLSCEAGVIKKHNGDIDKFVGDAVIAWFSGEDRCLRAVRAADEMITTLRTRFSGQPGTVIGVGIHVGEVVVGSVGSSDRKDYTAIGSVVNMTARLCSNAQPGQILVSQAVAAELNHAVSVRPLPPLSLKGFSEPVPVFEITLVDTAGAV